MSEYHRAEQQCAKCECYVENLEGDTLKDFEDAAPGEDCTLSCCTWSNAPCKFFQPLEE
jgi:hypothetical protein